MSSATRPVHELRAPNYKPIQLDHLSNTQLSTLYSLYGVDPAVADRPILLGVLTELTQITSEQDWTLTNHLVRTATRSAGPRRHASYQSSYLQLTPGYARVAHASTQAQAVPCVQGTTPGRSGGLLCSYQDQLNIFGGARPADQAFNLRCNPVSHLWEPVQRATREPAGFLDRACGEWSALWCMLCSSQRVAVHGQNSSTPGITSPVLCFANFAGLCKASNAS